MDPMHQILEKFGGIEFGEKFGWIVQLFFENLRKFNQVVIIPVQSMNSNIYNTITLDKK